MSTFRHAWLAVMAGLTASQGALAADLSLEDRVACQRAVEQVYWRHRGATGEAARLPFEQAVPEAVLRRKAEDAVRKSAALASGWSAEITPAQLQAEIDRMAASSQNPTVLAELFAALGNDGRMVAECLARPQLADRLIQSYFAADDRFQGAVRRQARAEMKAGQPTTAEQRVTTLVRGREAALATPGALLLTPEAFDERVQSLRRSEGGKTGQPALGRLSGLREDARRIFSVAIDALDADRVKLRTLTWRKADFDSWWRQQRKSQPNRVATAAAAYRLPTLVPNADCRNDSWKPTLSGLDGRYEHTAVWTGSEMIVWGGMEAVGFVYNDGSRYNPATDTWMPVSNTGAPGVRHAHSAAWTGSEMVVFGGDGSNTGGRYDPVTDTWRPTSTAGAPIGQQWAASVWTGKELIVWGGILGVPVNTGARYDPKADTLADPAGLAPAGALLHAGRVDRHRDADLVGL